jgi:hypothetical protein
MIRYNNVEAMRAIALQWRKAKQGDRAWDVHLLVFLEGARAVADLERAHELVIDIEALIDDLRSRGGAALADFIDLPNRPQGALR